MHAAISSGSAALRPTSAFQIQRMYSFVEVFIAKSNANDTTEILAMLERHSLVAMDAFRTVVLISYRAEVQLLSKESVITKPSMLIDHACNSP